MKIEKISDNQIRCTLYNSDLASRELKISELAYGTEKAKSLFHDMIEQADEEFGFKANEAPLMIEAIPISTDCIVLIITKVDSPEELDDKFSKLAPPSIDDVPDEFDDPDFVSLGHLMGGALRSSKSKKQEKSPKDFVPISETLAKDTDDDDSLSITLCNAFYFNSWDEAAAAAKKAWAGHPLNIESILFKNQDGKYILFLTCESKIAGRTYTNICDIISDYAKGKVVVPDTLLYFKEHCRTLIKHDALAILTEY